MLIDTHCHLNDSNAFPNPTLAIEEALMADVSRIVVVGVDLETSRYALQIAEKHSEIFATVGWHPNYAREYDSKYLKEMEELLKHPKALAVGEIGLDSHHDHSSRDEQMGCLVDQLDLAKSVDKPVIFHCREAYDDLLSVLEGRERMKFLFHCFLGNEDNLKRCMELDIWYGVNGPVTYKKADELRGIVAKLPKDKILLETDSPWLAPVPYRGKPNKPANLPYINSALAHLFEMSVFECAKMTTQNAVDFFGEALVV